MRPLEHKMKWKFFYGWLTGIVVIVGLSAFGLHWLINGLDLCEDVVIQEKQSPDSRLKAIVYSRNCGVFTTGFTTQVTIVKHSDSVPKELGNVYVEQSEDAQPKVSVQWNGNQSLVVKDDPTITGRIASEAENKVPVNLGWFQSVNVDIHYANVAMKYRH